MPDLKNLCYESVRKSPGRKASQITAELNSEGHRVSKSEVNSVLYRLKSDRRLRKDGDHCWHLADSQREPMPIPGQSETQTRSGNIRDIKLTAEQEQIVVFEPSGHLLVRGEPGSGKTTVLAHRAKSVAARAAQGSVLMLTYNRALASYTQNILEDLGCADQVRVKTFHQWIDEEVQELGCKSIEWAFNSYQLKNIIKNGVKEIHNKSVDHRLLELSESFWEDEIAWIYGQGIRTLERYESIPRVGRGTSIQVRGDDRIVAWKVFEAVDRELKSSGLVHGDNAVYPLLVAIKKIGGFKESMKFDHIFIDEAQDFHPSWLAILPPYAKVSMTVAGDLGQRIYRRTFTWKSCGIEVVGRSRSLVGSFRTTKQIMKVAIELLVDMELARDPDWLPPSLPDKEGPPVMTIIRNREEDLFDAIGRVVSDIVKQQPDSSIVVAHHFNRPLDDLVEAIRKYVNRVSKAKGNELGKMPAGVLVTTFFQLKGLEFDHVILVGLEDRLMPEWWVNRRDDSETEVEAEEYLRRLVYVAMTRARNSVFLAAKNELSRFFDEIDGSCFKRV